VNSTFETGSIMAAPRAFTNVKHALVWYFETRAAKSGRAINLETQRLPRAQSNIDSSEKSFALIGECLGPRHAADDLERDPEPMPEDHVPRLICWFASGWSQDSQAEEAGVSLHALQRWMKSTERRLRRRFEARGLLALRERT
jgi:hypothetical protein